MEWELKHISHEHPLVPFDASASERFSSICIGCGKGLHGSCYGCSPCFPSFHLHKSCFEVSQVVQHPIHNKHPLIICKIPPYDKETCTCNICGEPCMRFIVYHCPLCKIYVHFKCLSLPLSIESEIHNHLLTLFGKSITFSCDFCGKESKSMPYLCSGSTCGFCTHRKCASLSRMVKHMRHKHPLILTNSIKDDHSEHRVCQLCVKNVDTNYGVYYCSRCDYIAHLDCATDLKGIDENFMRESNGKEPAELTIMLIFEDLELDEFTNELSYSVQKTKVGEGEIKIRIEIKHFCHEHDLKLSDELENSKICDGCVRPIFPPFYSCIECNFFLHKSCAKLPHKKRHPLHRHLLNLKLNRPHFWWNTTRCHTCQRLSNGFIYNCSECNFSLDVPCSLTSELDTLTHVGHEHPLIFSSATNDEECSACNSKGRIFRCTKCEFTLDFGCVTLPHTVKYKQHEHPFILSYITEDDSGEYYCDICEEERNHPKHWFYYCKECSYPAHPECIFGKFSYYTSQQEDYRNIKFGSTCRSRVHQHPLTLVQETKDISHCNNCGRPCHDISYACATYNISFDEYCVC